ncbi:IS3 family transposase [Ruthenibacterium lactatiformans]|uniref:IS3 family transposase n=1 Tax=Ruthenibacterium lactatiformans TaxID=1550024 RepID=A0A6I3Q241_9FIRM|nr:IS3 family transposase [Ruthenibacterium lactatiformans]MTS17715.1 IS3 family transposase [Ruthenibacterium lactatiformans]MTS33419.1 IS3 family transposase [Ruthenibacterium lactatiformans]MTS47360.1 IS3 family transposase [Ruthenibacterium lactatiformans]MTS50211.1 IS3 family transposase [Ruthenibacterium lactatiformans]
MGCYFMPKGVPKYDGAFKKQIVEEMREKGLSYREIARQYEIRGAHSVAEMLEDKGVRQSMSRKGNCLDNAVMENFFGLLKTELLYLQDFDSLEHFKAELIDYLYYYNNRRIKLKLKGLTPAQHRYQTLQVA